MRLILLTALCFPLYAHAIGEAELETFASINDAPALGCAEVKTSSAAVSATTCARGKAIAKNITSTRPFILNPVNFSDAEKLKLPEQTKAINALEAALASAYAYDLSAKGVGWHGRQSQQRIIWQDPRVQAVLRDPAMSKVILHRAKTNAEKNLGDGNTLSSLLLYGLATNSFSYLTTASPNWANAPAVPSVSWTHLSDMKVPLLSEVPLEVSSAYLAQVTASCQGFEQALLSVYGAPSGTSQLDEAVQQTSTAQLVEGIFDVFSTLTDVQIGPLVSGAAGNSTEYLRMNGQSLEVMNSFHQLLAANGGDYGKTLGYGFVSHALDAKHLAAAMFGIQKGEALYRNVTTTTAQDNLKALIKKAVAGELGEPANSLMKTRLEQVFILITDKASALGLTKPGVMAKLSTTRRQTY